MKDNIDQNFDIKIKIPSSSVPDISNQFSVTRDDEILEAMFYTTKLQGPFRYFIYSSNKKTNFPLFWEYDPTKHIIFFFTMKTLTFFFFNS